MYVVPVGKFYVDSPKIQREIVNTGATEVEIRVVDPREVSKTQRRKARAIIGDIANWNGDPPDWLHGYFKDRFCTIYDIESFSLRDTDMTTARLYISYLIDFCLYHSVPLKKPILELCDDVKRALYSCLCHKKCVVCGVGAQLHHVDHVGMGRNREKIVHEGMKVQPLCAVHHAECHQIGQSVFDDNHHLESVVLDKYLCIKYGVNCKAD